MSHERATDVSPAEARAIAKKADIDLISAEERLSIAMMRQ
jgi:hypothetical protein